MSKKKPKAGKGRGKSKAQSKLLSAAGAPAVIGAPAEGSEAEYHEPPPIDPGSYAPSFLGPYPTDDEGEQYGDYPTMVGWTIDKLNERFPYVTEDDEQVDVAAGAAMYGRVVPVAALEPLGVLWSLATRGDWGVFGHDSPGGAIAQALPSARVKGVRVEILPGPEYPTRLADIELACRLKNAFPFIARELIALRECADKIIEAYETATGNGEEVRWEDIDAALLLALLARGRAHEHDEIEENGASDGIELQEDRDYETPEGAGGPDEDEAEAARFQRSHN